jgi:hypothetical protein
MLLDESNRCAKVVIKGGHIAQTEKNHPHQPNGQSLDKNLLFHPSHPSIF